MNTVRSTTEEGGRSAAERMVFFSDAVVAIALTLLAIELPVPTGVTARDLAEAFGRGWPEYLAFLISFVVISLYWNGHHRQFRYLVDAPPDLVRWNFLWLLSIVLIPFATRVLTGGEGDDVSAFPWRFGFYAVIQVVSGMASIMSARSMKHEDLVDEGAPDDLAANTYRRAGVFVVTFGLSIPLAFLVGQWAYFVWGFGPWVLGTAWGSLRRRRGRVRTGASAS